MLGGLLSLTETESLSLLPSAATPVDNAVDYTTDNYPDRTENTNPDEYVG